MREIHKFKKIKYSAVEEKVESRKLLHLPPGNTLEARLPMVKIQTANYCDRGHITRLQKSIRKLKCFVTGCESVTSRLVTVQVIGKKIYLLDAADNPTPINTTMLTNLPMLALTEINQVGGESRETRSANPVDRIFRSVEDVFNPTEWTDDVFQVNLKNSLIIAYDFPTVELQTDNNRA